MTESAVWLVCLVSLAIGVGGLVIAGLIQYATGALDFYKSFPREEHDL